MPAFPAADRDANVPSVLFQSSHLQKYTYIILKSIMLADTNKRSVLYKLEKGINQFRNRLSNLRKNNDWWAMILHCKAILGREQPGLMS